MQGFFNLLGKLWPTNLNTEKELQNWRILVALGLMFAVSTTILHMALSFGHIPMFAGFASAETVQSIQVQLLKRDLRDLRRDQCKAISEQNSPAMSFAVEELDDLLPMYEDIVGRPWRIPDCEELG